MELPVDDLPQEIITQILLRLPTKSLLQFTCVCKSWNSLIKHTSFINTHLNLNLNNTSNTPLLLLRHCPKDPNREQYSLHLDNDTFQEYSKPDLPLQSFNECFRIVGSCNGLVLLTDDYLSDTNTCILWNPSIRKFITLAKPHVSLSSYYSVYGFGFDSKNNDYKVVRLVYLSQDHAGPKRTCPEVELYSLSSGSWKSITAAAPNYEISQTIWSQVFVNGAIHWIAFCRKENGIRNVVLAFDVRNEVFQKIELPEDLACAVPTIDHLVISVVGKSISVKHYDPTRQNHCCYIWVMREYGVVESWTKQFTIDLKVIPNLRLVKVMGSRINGELLLEMFGRNRGELVSHDPKNNRNEFLGIHTDPGYSCIEYYMESLVLLNRTN